MAKVMVELYKGKKVKKIMEDAKRFVDYGALKFNQGRKEGARQELEKLIAFDDAHTFPKSGFYLTAGSRKYIKARLRELGV